MKRCIWVVVLLAGMLVSSGARAQEDDKRQSDLDEAVEKMEIRARHLELQQCEAELEFDNEIRELDLEERRLELERKYHSPERRGGHGRGRGHGKLGKGHGGFLVICGIVNILLAVWVFQDIRKRNAGSGIWIVVTLLVGFFGALLYAIVRLGDKQ